MDGYPQLKLCKDGKSCTVRIHRLVAEAFILNPDPISLLEVNHIDCDRTNNFATNLEWCTHIDNVRHSSALGKYKHYGSNNPNYGNHILGEIYKSNPALALEKLSRPQAQNGHARRVDLYDEQHNFIREFSWIGACANFLIENGNTNSKIDSIRSRISVCAKNGTKYLDHYYKFA